MDFIARSEDGVAGAYSFNDPGQIKAEHCWEWLLGVCCFAPTELDIERIDAAGVNPGSVDH
jgi:hypothetical protein